MEPIEPPVYAVLRPDSARRELWLRVLGTDRVRLKSSAPEKSTLPGLPPTPVYFMDAAFLDAGQRARLVEFASVTFGVSPEVVLSDIDGAHGVPILATEVILEVEGEPDWYSLPFEDQERLFRVQMEQINQGKPIRIAIPPVVAFAILGNLQLALRHEQNTGWLADAAEKFARLIQERIATRGIVAHAMRMGWHPEFDKREGEHPGEGLSDMVKRRVARREAETYRHVEAFALMKYASDDGMLVEWVWNSRDGVTPFTIRSRDSDTRLTHIDWHLDRCVPAYQPQPCERIFVDMTQDYAVRSARRHIGKSWDTGPNPLCKRYADKAEAEAGLVAKYLAEPGQPTLITAAEWKQ